MEIFLKILPYIVSALAVVLSCLLKKRISVPSWLSSELSRILSEVSLKKEESKVEEEKPSDGIQIPCPSAEDGLSLKNSDVQFISKLVIGLIKNYCEKKDGD